MAALAGDLGSKAYRRVRLRIVGSAVAVSRDLGIVELGEVLAEIGVGGQAVVAAVDLGDRKRDAAGSAPLPSAPDRPR